MNTLFWVSATFMSVVLLARFAVPRVAPDTALARFLTNTITFDDGDTDDTNLR